jgi:uncharacterized protein DUF4926
MKELDIVVLATDMPKYRLQKGDIGTLVLVHQGGKGYEVEFTTPGGETIAAVSVSSSQVRPGRNEIANARGLERLSA